MKQFCGLDKEEHLSSLSNSECPLALIYHVVCDFWKSEALENNQIWKMSPLLLSFLLCGNKLSGTRVNIVCFSLKKKTKSEWLTRIVVSYLGLSVWFQLGLWWISCRTGRSKDINFRKQRKPGCRATQVFLGCGELGKVYFGLVAEIPLHFLLLILCRRPTLLSKSWLCFRKRLVAFSSLTLWPARCLSPHLLICLLIVWMSPIMKHTRMILSSAWTLLWVQHVGKYVWTSGNWNLCVITTSELLSRGNCGESWQLNILRSSS